MCLTCTVDSGKRQSLCLQGTCSLNQWFSTWGRFCSPWNIWQMPGDIFHCHNLGGATDMQWVEARDIAGHLTMHRMAPITKKNPLQNINSAEGEKLVSTEWSFQIIPSRVQKISHKKKGFHKLKKVHIFSPS